MKFLFGLIAGVVLTSLALSLGKLNSKPTYDSCIAGLYKLAEQAAPAEMPKDPVEVAQADMVFFMACDVAKKDPNAAFQYLLSLRLAH